MVKNINILYNYDINFYDVIKMSINCTISLPHMIPMRVGNQKATTINKVRAMEHICVLNPVK